MTPPPRPAPRVWLPLAVSLALHAALGLAALLLAAGKGAQARGPAPVDACVLDDDGGTIVLDGPARAEKPRGGSEEAEEAFPAQVAELPIVAPVPGGVAIPPKASGEPSAPGGAGGADGGGRGGIGLLRPPATARTVVYVIDRSLSMGLSDALPLAKRELLAGLDVLPADAHFAVILYNRQAEPLTPDGQTGLLPATDVNRATVARLVEDVHAEGGTDHLAALRCAVELGPDVIFFVTDADEMTAEQVRSVARLNRGRAVIHAIELNNESDRREETPLKLLARLSGGTYRRVPVKR